jgi:hypothetical protein
MKKNTTYFWSDFNIFYQTCQDQTHSSSSKNFLFVQKKTADHLLLPTIVPPMLIIPQGWQVAVEFLFVFFKEMK